MKILNGIGPGTDSWGIRYLLAASLASQPWLFKSSLFSVHFIVSLSILCPTNFGGYGRSYRGCQRPLNPRYIRTTAFLLPDTSSWQLWFAYRKWFFSTPLDLQLLKRDLLQQCSQGLRLTGAQLFGSSFLSFLTIKFLTCMKSKWFNLCLTMPSCAGDTPTRSGAQGHGRPEDKPWKWKTQYKRYLAFLMTLDTMLTVPASNTYTYLTFILLLMYFKKPFLSCTSLSWTLLNSIPI